MRTSLKKFSRFLVALTVLSALLQSPVESPGAEPNQDADLPPGSIVFHGAPKPANQSAGLDSAATPTSPEYLFGLKVEQATKTNDVSIINNAFDLDALYNRFVPTLPVSDNVKQQLYAKPHENAVWRLTLLKDIVSDVTTMHLYFLGVRSYGPDIEILFRDVNATGGPYYKGSPVYIGYVTQRQPDGTVRLVDVHRILSSGELLSQTLRREIVLDLARKGFVHAPLDASDAILLANVKPYALYEIRCGYGRYNLVKPVYDQLPPQLQDNPHILFQNASCGEHNAGDIVVPIERWHKLNPDDPCPYLLLVDFYWRLYNGPRYNPSGPDRGTHLESFWTPEEENGVTAAVQKANVWFDDPAMEVRLARYFAAKQPAKARSLLLQATQRTRPFPQAFSELLTLDLIQRNYAGVAETLHHQETAFQTNLTSMVNTSRSFSEFKKSPAFRKWRHDNHAAGPVAEK